MTPAIPDRFAPVLSAVEAVATELGLPGELRSFGPGRWIRDVGPGWADPVAHVAFVLDTDVPLLGLYVILRLPVGRPLAEAVARANYGMLPGCFELDVDSGELRYRTALVPVGGETTTPEVAELLSDSLVIVKAYAPAFAAVLAGGDPRAAIAEAEAP